MTYKFFIVGIGASAGGLQPLQEFFANLENNSNAAFVVVQHLSPDFKSMMSELLQPHTQMPVHQITDHTEILINNVYILPPRKNVIIENQQLKLLEKSEPLNFPINQFFESLAKECKEKAIGILLSGTGNDGTEGMKAISKARGISLVQSSETAQFNSMPSSSIPFGIVDEILSPADLAQAVHNLITFNPYFAELKTTEDELIGSEYLKRVIDIIAKTEQIDFSHYKINTISRRIANRCTLTRQINLESYINLLKNSEEEQKLLRQDLLIGATRFFRDPEVWKYLETEVLPPIIDQLAQNQQLRIWVSACATGEEAYTMGILIDEALQKANKKNQVKIFTTDLDTHALEVASSGVYPESITNDITPERLAKYFIFNGKSYQAIRSLREMLIIAPHNLTKNAGFSKMNLISCRNVLIYMQPHLQQQVIRLLHFSLANQGILFLGKSETLAELAPEFIPLEAQFKIYRKKRDIGLSLLPFSRQPIIPTMQNNINFRPHQLRFDRILGEVFKFCFSEQLLTCVLINKDNQLLHTFYNEAQLLELPVGQPNLDITEIVIAELKFPLATALHRAKRSQESVVYTDIKFTRNEEEQTVNLRISFTPQVAVMSEYLIIMFELVSQVKPISQSTINIIPEVTDQMRELEYELQETRQNLQMTIDDLEVNNEEQQATNEELLASNEELQNTNEELQSTNEELYVVNAEYQSKVEELTQLSNDIDNLLLSTDIGVIFLDMELKIRKFTPAATKIINICATDINRPLKHFTHNIDCPNLIEIIKIFLDSKEAKELEVNILKTEEYFLMRINHYYQDNGEINGIVLTFINITELKTVQNKLEESNQQLAQTNLKLQAQIAEEKRIQFALEEATKKAELANLAKSEFLANMSHEIRTPMNAIIGFCDLLKMKITEPRQLKYINTVISSGHSLLQIIDDILDLSKLEAGKLKINYEWINLREYIKEIEDIFITKINTEHIDLFLDFADNLPNIIQFDSIRLRQILFNLVGNAIKFTHEGYVKISITYENLLNSTITLKITIEDTGIGIESKDQEKIFEPFIQSDSSMTREYSGTGLGLTITKRLTELLNGTIELESTLDQGSKFILIFPDIRIYDLTNVTLLNAENTDKDIPQFSLQNILVIDDIESNRELIIGCFENTNYKLFTANNGQEAIKIINQENIELILLDLRMPNMSGEEIIDILKANPQTQTIPIIIITASIKSEVEALKLSVQGFLRKPIRCNELMEEIAKVMKNLNPVSIDENIILENIDQMWSTDDKIHYIDLDAESLGKLLEKLQQQNPLWLEVSKTLVHNKMIEFTQNLLSLNKEYPYLPLIEYTKNLEMEITEFNIDTIGKHLADFPNLLSNINQELEKFTPSN
jgi:signal transduction histidine kinase/chemotaxis methyl-accepting protein methylase/chemotaxis response regulator CheB